MLQRVTHTGGAPILAPNMGDPECSLVLEGTWGECQRPFLDLLECIGSKVSVMGRSSDFKG